jgi:hypothetical protein
MDIQSKLFDGANCSPTLYSLINNGANITWPGTLPDLAIPRPNTKDDYTFGI